MAKPTKEFESSKDTANGLAGALESRLLELGCWVRRYFSRSSGSDSLYIEATRIYGEMYNDAERSMFNIRVSGHRLIDDSKKPCLLIDIYDLADANIRLKSQKDSCSGVHSVDCDVWNNAIDEVFKSAQTWFDSDTRTSPESAIRELGGDQAWDKLERAHDTDQRVEGALLCVVKDGFIVDLGDAVAFLPGSKADVPESELDNLLAEHKNLKQPFRILKLCRRHGDIVVSRWANWEKHEQRAEERAKVIGSLSEGQTVEGVVKNITEYGAFVELEAGVEGLVHVIDMAWHHVNHPSEILTISETIKVQIIKCYQITKGTHHISLGMKQLQDYPWNLSDGLTNYLTEDLDNLEIGKNMFIVPAEVYLREDRWTKEARKAIIVMKNRGREGGQIYKINGDMNVTEDELNEDIDIVEISMAEGNQDFFHRPITCFVKKYVKSEIGVLRRKELLDEVDGGLHYDVKQLLSRGYIRNFKVTICIQAEYEDCNLMVRFNYPSIISGNLGAYAFKFSPEIHMTDQLARVFFHNICEKIVDKKGHVSYNILLKPEDEAIKQYVAVLIDDHS